MPTVRSCTRSSSRPSPSSTAWTPELDAIEVDIEERATAARLAELAADPTQHEEYLIQLAMDRARRMTLAVRDDLDIRRGRVVADDDAAVRAAVTAYVATVDDLGTLPHSDSSDPIRSRMSTLADDGRALLLRLDGQAFDSSERFRLEGVFASEVFGSPQRLTQDYNELVEEYNRA